MVAEWWQDETFWREIGPFMYNSELMASADEDAEDLLEMVDIEDGARVLDIGCAVGRLVLPMVQRGYRVVGVDPCDAYRRRCRERAAAAGLEVDVRARNVFDLRLGDGERFDLVLDVFAVLGYATDPVQDIVAVKAMSEALDEGGQLLICTRHPRATHGTVKRRAAGAICIEERNYERSTKMLHTKWSIVRGGRTKVHNTRVRVYEREDLVGLLEFCGFTDVMVFDSEAEHRLALVATRPSL